MKIGFCADNKEQIQYYIDIINHQKLTLRGDIVKIYTPEQLLFDVEENFFDSDILITDIYYEGVSYNGISVVKKINEAYPLCQVIYSSKFVEYIDYTYETEYVYFIQKKNLPKLLGKALQKAREKYQLASHVDIFEFYSNGIKRYVKICDIYYIERNDRRVNIYTPTEIYQTSLSIKQICDKLDGSNIVRISGSTAVNVEHIQSYNMLYLNLENSNRRLEISPRYNEKTNEVYEKYWKNK